MMRSGADHCGTERGLQACADVAQADRTVEALLQRGKTMYIYAMYCW